ncbi:hypothetical protein FHL15_003255 [Xylaria flabelliformis]|uniref:Uncharacterized protein n=1 Tax=Xylaria flabelliformis TaxID=2512241 RepID=A0A553I665_9PEZI|nr:hypothetical protein FHL15_003255 [Xylaria flabelliformis]
MDFNTAAIQFGRLARHLIVREDDESKCHPRPDIDLCEKPASSDKTTPITIGVIVGIIVVGTGAVLTYFHLRRKRKDEEEWPKNNQELEDYGIIAPSSTVRQPQAAHHPPEQPPPQYSERDQRHEPARSSLDNLEHSLRGGQTTGAFRRQDEQISADMKPVQPSDHL